MKRGQTVDKLLERTPIPLDFYAHRMSPFLNSVCLSVQSRNEILIAPFYFFICHHIEQLFISIFKSKSYADRSSPRIN